MYRDTQYVHTYKTCGLIDQRWGRWLCVRETLAYYSSKAHIIQNRTYPTLLRLSELLALRDDENCCCPSFVFWCRRSQRYCCQSTRIWCCEFKPSCFGLCPSGWRGDSGKRSAHACLLLLHAKIKVWSKVDPHPTSYLSLHRNSANALTLVKNVERMVSSGTRAATDAEIEKMIVIVPLGRWAISAVAKINVLRIRIMGGHLALMTGIVALFLIR